MYHKDRMIHGNTEQFKRILRLQGRTLVGTENRNLQKIHNPASPLTFSVFHSFFSSAISFLYSQIIMET